VLVVVRDELVLDLREVDRQAAGVFSGAFLDD
jgi:hypothetical protein